MHVKNHNTYIHIECEENPSLTFKQYMIYNWTGKCREREPERERETILSITSLIYGLMKY